MKLKNSYFHRIFMGLSKKKLNMNVSDFVLNWKLKQTLKNGINMFNGCSCYIKYWLH